MKCGGRKRKEERREGGGEEGGMEEAKGLGLGAMPKADLLHRGPAQATRLRYQGLWIHVDAECDNRDAHDLSAQGARLPSQ